MIFLLGLDLGVFVVAGVDELKAQIDIALEKVKKAKILNRDRGFNFFRATGAANYEIRHAAFFAWLFDPRQHDMATNFVLHFIDEVCRVTDSDSLFRKVRGLRRDAASKKLRVSPIFEGVESLTELCIDKKRRIDFACDVSRDGERDARIVIEFKLKGVVQNDLNKYYEAVSASKDGNGKDVYCFLIDFSGKDIALDDPNFIVVDTDALIQAVSRHYDFLDSLADEKYRDIAQAVRQYREILIDHVGAVDLAIKDTKSRALLWEIWPPEMDRSKSTKQLDLHLEKRVEKVLVGEAAEDAYSHTWWQLLATDDLYQHLNRSSDLSCSLKNGYTIDSRYGEVRARISIVMGKWLSLIEAKKKKAIKDKVYIRIYVEGVQFRYWSDEINELDGLDDAFSAVTLNYGSGGFELLHKKQSGKARKNGPVTVFLIEVEVDELKKRAVMGKRPKSIGDAYEVVESQLLKLGKI
ncbi:PD-(D/E)XK nuclease family protein [Alcanivorax sp.]|uniref:PD-(D/E)XK nuclease family protein n=1 Tax=Alcanivorax sp. TaxID=1872427 RepID=UPI002352576F|nr:PD-(D/E)XK nuclease family protein [Alcanivorax sp.]